MRSVNVSLMVNKGEDLICLCFRHHHSENFLLGLFADPPVGKEGKSAYASGKVHVGCNDTILGFQGYHDRLGSAFGQDAGDEFATFTRHCLSVNLVMVSGGM